MKGVNFSELKDAGDPVELARKYNQDGIDELVFLDVTASTEKRNPIFDVIKRTADEVFIPLTVGGGVANIEHVDKLLRAGADKVSVNTAAIKNPKLLSEIGERFGEQVIVLSIDTKRSITTKSGFEITTHGGRTETGIDLLDWVIQSTDIGVGEILLNSIDFDGTKNGFDLELIKLVSNNCESPIIASGGAGRLNDFPEAVVAGADAVLAASIFHFGELGIQEVKQAMAKVTTVRI